MLICAKEVYQNRDKVGKSVWQKKHTVKKITQCVGANKYPKAILINKIKMILLYNYWYSNCVTNDELAFLPV